MTMAVQREMGGTLADVIDRILDKGLVINADITVSVIGVELLGIKIRALASFETAAIYGLEFPSGTQLPEWAGKRLPEWAGTKEGSFSRNGATPVPQYHAQTSQ